MSNDKAPEYNYILPPEDCTICEQILGRQPHIDPCGHPAQFLKAERIYYGTNREDDGMLIPWVDANGNPATVVMNPTHNERTPKEQPGFTWYPLSRWMMKASAEAQKGATIIGMLPATVDRSWFHANVVELCASICFLEKRLKSYLPDYENDGPPIQQKQPKTPYMYALWTRDKPVFERFYEVLGRRNDEGMRRGFVVEPNPIE